MNAALGSVSAGGMGTPEFDVIHNGGGPSAFVASQSEGNVGGLTSSKFTLSTIGPEQRGHGLGAGVTSAADVLARPTRAHSGETGAVRPIGRDSAIRLNAIIPAERGKAAQIIFHNRVSVAMAAGVQQPF